jgi:hypothetical protein
VCNADFGDNTPFYRPHRRDEVFPVGKQPGIIEVLCLEGRIVVVPEASGNSCSVHRVLANCAYLKDRSYSLTADVLDFAFESGQLLN